MRIGKYYELFSWGDLAIWAGKITLFVAFIAALWMIMDRFTVFNDFEEIFVRRNLPYAFERGSLVLGQSIGMIALVNYKSDHAAVDFLWLVGGSVWTMLVLLLVRGLLYRRVKPKRDITEALLSVGLFRGFSYVACGFVILAGLSGSAPNMIVGVSASIAFTMTALAVMSGVYMVLGRLPKLKLHSRIREGNVSAALIAGSFILSLGYVMRNAIAGDFTHWGEGFIGFGVIATISLVIGVLMSLLIDRVVLRSTTIGEMIQADDKLAAGVMAVMVFAVALAAGSAVI